MIRCFQSVIWRSVLIGAVVGAFGAMPTAARANAIVSFTLSSQSNAAYSDLTAAGGAPGTNQFSDPVGTTLGTQPPAVNISGTATGLPLSTATWLATLSGSASADLNYLFTVNILNNVAPQHPIGPTWFNLTAGTAAVGAGAIRFNTVPTPTSNYNSYNNFDPGATTATQLWFGGLAGGGGEFYNGQTGVFTFPVFIPAGTSGTFSFILTANPEPTSLVLGSIGMMTMGGIGYLRRRKEKVPPPAEASA